jgi:hypothetical protein
MVQREVQRKASACARVFQRASQSAARRHSADRTHRVSVEEFRSSEVLFEARASSSNNAILAIHGSLRERDPGDRDAE